MSSLDQLFYWRGIADSYLNYRGEHVEVPHGHRLKLLQAMGADISGSETIAEQAYELDVAPWKEWTPALIVSPSYQSNGFFLNISPEELTERFFWSINLGNVEVRTGEFYPKDLLEVGDYLYDGKRYSRRFCVVDELSPQYYELSIRSLDKKRVTTLAQVPETAFLPEWSTNNKRIWGSIIQLYTLRSNRNWGIGDFSDLKELIERTASLGASCIGLNPLHVLLPDLSYNCSPYSPSDRRFINPLYIDPTSVPEYPSIGEGNEDVRRQQEKVISMLEALRASEKVLYTDVKHAKYWAFEQLFNCFEREHLDKKTSRGQAFLAFLSSTSETLRSFALWEVASNHWQCESFKSNLKMENIIHAVESNSMDSLCRDNARGLLFHCYLQWIANDQLNQCQDLAINLGMDLGLIRDLAVGADGGGSEVTTNSELFCRGATVGAPPDPLAQQGQNWGLPPMDPMHLRDSGYKHFIRLLRANMRSCGALRIDHAMSLMRLWWCPPGETADQGAYVYYAFEDMLGILLLESHLNECAIIGEDLGVVPAEFREAITRAKIFTNKVFYFEKEGPGFKLPERYDDHALAMINNHDVPTLSSWWMGSDLVLRNELELFEEGVSYEQLCIDRGRERQSLIDLLKSKNLCPDSWIERDLSQPADQELIFAIIALSSEINSQIFVLQLEDLIMMDEPVNVPGTFKEHVNWQRKLKYSTSEIFSNENINNLLANVNDARKRVSPES